MTDHVFQQLIDKSRDTKPGGFGFLSTGEKLATALVLNGADWLADMGYTMAEAIDRLDSSWVSRIPTAARQMDSEASADEPCFLDGDEPQEPPTLINRSK